MKNDIVQQLEAERLNYRVLGGLIEGRIVILERGARVLAINGSYGANSAAAESPLWTDLAAIRQGSWNVGGDRTWVSPELSFFCRSSEQEKVGAEAKPEKDYYIPVELDPGSYCFKEREAGDKQTVQLEQTASLFSSKTSQFVNVGIIKRFNLVKNPLFMNQLSFYAHLRDVCYVGYECWTQLKTLPDRTSFRVSDSAAPTWCNLWSIIQVLPGGEVIIPTRSSSQPLDMFDNDAKHTEHYETSADHLRISYRGDGKFKLSLSVFQSKGRFGYLRQLDHETASLTIRQFQVNPSGFYPDYPLAQPNYSGSCMQFFYDGGTMGSFGELEYHTPALNYDAHEHSIEDQSQVWHYCGPRFKINEIAKVLLGVNLTL